MSTRAQVQVIQEGLGWEESVTLYHHTDGYPSNIVPLIQKAYQYDCSYQKGRAGKVASLLCFTDPMVFEPKDNHELHGDIEYYYRLYLINQNMGSMGENPKWELEIFTSHGSERFWDDPKFENLKLIYERTPVEEIDGKLIEKGDN